MIEVGAPNARAQNVAVGSVEANGHGSHSDDFCESG